MEAGITFKMKSTQYGKLVCRLTKQSLYYWYTTLKSYGIVKYQVLIQLKNNCTLVNLIIISRYIKVKSQKITQRGRLNGQLDTIDNI